MQKLFIQQEAPSVILEHKEQRKEVGLYGALSWNKGLLSKVVENGRKVELR